MTTLIDGNRVKKELLDDLKITVSQLSGVPGLAVILVGDNPASKAYIGMKKKACDQLGIRSFEFLLPSDASEQEVMDVIDTLNEKDDVHGILLQMPLPQQCDEQKMLARISPEKDVDGFHPVNVGKLLIGLDTFKSCTPMGVAHLLQAYQIQTEGQHVVIIGRSNIVGKPMAAILIQNELGANATVTVCHSRTKNLRAITQQADILIAAIGKAWFVTEDMVKDGAVVIDVGINRVDNDTQPKGYQLVGDVDFETVKEKTRAITPVPGGVGPLTIAMLMKNTVLAFERQTAVASS
ncbi:MAG: bifunctional methylenetetrahydrofolate dehydrogenase/methenyltetrahydrofolate cyclohydrolase FolD [Candidatus Marinamargulisbacteria bacterium]